MQAILIHYTGRSHAAKVEKQKSLRCDICDATFVQGSKLNRHLKSKGHLATVAGVKKKVAARCDICNATFAQISGLTRHLKSPGHAAAAALGQHH
jgi:uncharacterized C2H2 Zn-finger protein